MKLARAIAVVAGIMVAWGVSADARAQSAWNPFETVDEARQRHSAERWMEYERHGRQVPLGGYSSSLGDPAPYGTEQPGYASPRQQYGYGGGYRVPSYGSRYGR